MRPTAHAHVRARGCQRSHKSLQFIQPSKANQKTQTAICIFVRTLINIIYSAALTSRFEEGEVSLPFSGCLNEIRARYLPCEQSVESTRG